MAIGAEAETAYENPLIPNATLRQIYLAMVRTRLLERALAARKRQPQSARTLGLEACLVSPCVDLGRGDLIVNAINGGTLDFLRGATADSVLRPDGRARKHGLKADCGAATRLPAVAESRQRIWAALGAAAALKAGHARQKPASAAAAENLAEVVVVYARANELSPALWRKVMAFASVQQLAALFVVLPGSGQTKAGRSGTMSAIAQQHGIPGMPVDAGDPAALYRVAQEAIGRARIGGGPALMECVSFRVKGAGRRQGAPADPIAALEDYLLHRRISTRKWMEREAKSFAKGIER